MPDTLTKDGVANSVELFEFTPGRKASIATLKTLLPDIETALFFGMVYKLDADKLGTLLRKLFKTTVVKALLKGHHSCELQGYVIDLADEDRLLAAELGDVSQLPWLGADEHTPPDTELLAQLWEAAAVELADSIAQVAAKISGVIDSLPSKYGQMTFAHLRKLNVKRGTIGTYTPLVAHQRQAKNLVIFDVSGSMSSTTVQKIVGEVVGLAYKANAALAIVSNNTFFWEAGNYSVDAVLRAAEYGGTHYESLLPILHEHWGTVVTIADYDSSRGAADFILRNARGSIQEILDISLVGRPTFLAECLGPLAKSLRPLLIGKHGEYGVIR